MVSIVIPAHNEGRVIERCLQSLLNGAGPDELEVAVVCNACVDDTAERARRFDQRVKVIETPIGSKIHALNLGDAHVSSFPRFYVDADIELSISAIREVAAILGQPSVLAAAPRAVVDYSDRPWFIQSYYRAWTRLPYFTEDMIGAGVYAFSREGRARFGAFPDVTADDEFARRIVDPAERRAARHSSFTIHPPRTLEGLLKIVTRARAARYELNGRFPELETRSRTGPFRTLRALLARPSLWLDAPVYLGVTLMSVRRARQKMREKTNRVWDRDDSSRQ